MSTREKESFAVRHRAIQEAGRIWSETVAEIPALKKRIRAEAEDQIDQEVSRRRTDAARAISAALDSGPTMYALRQVRTKNHFRGKSLTDPEH